MANKRPKQPRKPHTGFGYVYVIACDPWPGHPPAERVPCKIGLTKEPNKRLTQVQVLHPFRVRLVAVFPAACALEGEGEVHQEFAAHRLRGEWFHLSREQLDELASRMDRFNREWVAGVEARAEERLK